VNSGLTPDLRAAGRVGGKSLRTEFERRPHPTYAFAFPPDPEGALRGKGHLFLLISLLVAAGPAGCQSPPDDGGSGGIPPAENGERPAEATGREFEFYGPGEFVEVLQEAFIFFGGDRPPSRAIQAIREVHDLRDWSLRRDVPDAVGKCREAVRDLTRSDYKTWHETAVAVVVLSEMSIRHPSALIRHECVDALEWFDGWIHPDAEKMGPGVETTEADVGKALRALDRLAASEKPPADPAERIVCVEAVTVLGSHVWDDGVAKEPAVIRTRLSRPRGILVRLIRPDLQRRRADEAVSDTLDRAILRLADTVIRLSQMAALGDRTAHVRARAAKAVARCGDARATAPLAWSLEAETRADVKRELAAALGEVAGSERAGEAVPALGAALSHSSPSVRSAAARALAKVTGEDPGPDTSDWQRWWTEHSGEYGKR